MAAVKPAAEADTKAETPTAKAAEVIVQVAKSDDQQPPKTADAAREQDLELAAMRDELRLAREFGAAKQRELDALKSVQTQTEKAHAAGKALPSMPRAIVRVIGSGRVEKSPGDLLLPEEILGLTEGVHFELR
jgi:hypothetical protein